MQTYRKDVWTQLGKRRVVWIGRLNTLPGCPVDSLIKNLSTMQETQVQSLGWGDPLEKEIATYSSILAWEIPWTEEPDRQQSSSDQFSRSLGYNSLWPHGLQHARPPCPSPTPQVYSNSCPLSRWCHPTISSSVVPFSSRPQSFPASESFQMSQFLSGGQSIGPSASASVLPMTIQDWSPLGWTGWISLQFKGLSRVFFNTTVQKHQFFSAQLQPMATVLGVTKESDTI